MKKGQKTQKKFQLKNKENRQKAGLKSCFWALIGTNRDELVFWVVGRDVGFGSPNRDCPDEIGTVGKYATSSPIHARQRFSQYVMRGTDTGRSSLTSRQVF